MFKLIYEKLRNMYFDTKCKVLLEVFICNSVKYYRTPEILVSKSFKIQKDYLFLLSAINSYLGHLFFLSWLHLTLSSNPNRRKCKTQVTDLSHKVVYHGYKKNLNPTEPTYFLHTISVPGYQANYIQLPQFLHFTV